MCVCSRMEVRVLQSGRGVGTQARAVEVTSGAMWVCWGPAGGLGATTS